MAKSDAKQEVFAALRKIVEGFAKGMDVRKDSAKAYELYGTKEVDQGKKTVDGMYFASVMAKSNSVGFYFFPIYTDPQEFTDISEALRKTMTGKSCFTLKAPDPDLYKEIKKLLTRGRKLYRDKGWL